METRKITVVVTKNQKKTVIMSAATTLAELKADLTRNGIDYTDMSFFEGVSKVELKSDNAMLPHDVPYKGTTTNELVFMLTNTNKKIKSGVMSRTEAYEVIKDKKLQAKCIDKYGKNYTVCKTSELIALIEENCAKPVEKVKDFVDTNARDAIHELVDILCENDYLSCREANAINDLLRKEVSATETVSSYSDEEIADIRKEEDTDVLEGQIATIKAAMQNVVTDTATTITIANNYSGVAATVQATGANTKVTSNGNVVTIVTTENGEESFEVVVSYGTADVVTLKATVTITGGVATVSSVEEVNNG